MFAYFHPASWLILALMLVPGLIVGTIVAFKTRSGWALPITVLGSLAGLYTVSVAASYTAKVMIWLLRPIFGVGVELLDFNHYGSSLGGAIFTLVFHLPIILSVGLIAGAVLTGMLLLARQEARQRGGSFSIAHTIAAIIGTTITGGFVISLLVLLLAFLFGVGGWFLNLMPFISSDTKSLIGVIGFGLTILLGGLLGGFGSALAGTRFATFLI